jgi:hypothetical protein
MNICNLTINLPLHGILAGMIGIHLEKFCDPKAIILRRVCSLIDKWPGILQHNLLYTYKGTKWNNMYIAIIYQRVGSHICKGEELEVEGSRRSVLCMYVCMYVCMCWTKTIFSSVLSGWPDWANFRRLSDCFLWAYFKWRKGSKLFWQIFYQ